MAVTTTALVCALLSLLSISHSVHGIKRWPGGASTRFYDFKVQTKRVTKLCNSKEIVTINEMYPGPVVYAQEDDRLIIRVSNLTPHNATIHWHGVRQRLSCWSDGPSYVTQCPIQPGQTFSYEFTLVQQKGTFFWHAHVSWLRATVYGALIVYPRPGVPYPFPYPYQEHIVILGEYWLRDPLKIEQAVLASGGGAPIADAYTINGHPGPNYNCSVNVEADAEYTKALHTDKVMLAPGQTLNVLVTADQPISRYSMAVGPYMSAMLPSFNDNLAVKTVMDGLRGLNTSDVPKVIDKNLFVTIGVNVNKCNRKNPKKNCQGTNGGVFAASMNNISFIRPNVSLLEAYYRDKAGYFTDDFPGAPLKFYDFVNGAPNNAPNDTNAMNGTRLFVLEYGTRIQLILQDTGTVSTENHPIHLHGYSFYVVGYGTGNYNPDTANFNLMDPPYMNTIGVPVGGWAAIRFTADNPGVWFMHCHLEIHLSWGLSVAIIVKNGQGPLETLPHPPADYPRC